MYGVNGKVLWVNLTDSTFEVEDVKEDIYRKYLTGNGLGSGKMHMKQKIISKQ